MPGGAEKRSWRAAKRIAVLVGALLLLQGYVLASATPLASTESLAPPRLADQPQPPRAPSIGPATQAATVNAVGTEADDALSDMDDAVAPMLYLTPRVTNILRNVFDASVDGAAPAPQPTESTSPVADSVPRDAVESHDQEQTVDETLLPSFQRQMFRTDI